MLDDEQIRSGYVMTTVVDDSGTRSGMITLNDLAGLVGRVFRWDLEHRGVKMINRFAESPYIAFGENGGKWMAVKEVAPVDLYLNTVAGDAYKVSLPKMVAKVSNFAHSSLFWTKDEQLTPKSKLYPLVIGNISETGWICIGSTGLKCDQPKGIDKFIHQVIEAPSTGTYIPQGVNVEEFYQALTERWDESVGAKSAITLEKLLASTE